MSRLATSIQELEGEYDVVVVGSGYGGAIAASRLARAGLSVCVLERGEEFLPGEFPESSAEGLREIQIDTEGRRIGSRTGLFDFKVNPDISVLSGCGLGGTSLINANVAIEPDRRLWNDPIWPEAIRGDVDDGIAEGFRRAREMLVPTPLPERRNPSKLVAMQKSAAHMGAPFVRPPIAVNFDDRVNHVGVEQPACNDCGNCVGGCNVGAKNTVAMNYLPDARNHGAHILTRASVRRVERRGEKWLVHFDLLEHGLQRFDAQSRFIAADTVVLGAGSLGSTEILLRSRENGLPLSDRLGHGFTGNGDVLGFAYNADQRIDGIGVGSRKGKQGPGPCITGMIDLRGTESLEDGMIIEEGVIPSSLTPMLATSLLVAARMIGRDTDSGLLDYAQEKVRELQAIIPGGSTGAVGNTQTFLVMAHDDGQGRIHLSDDRVRISWPGAGGQSIFDRIDGELYRATEALGGTYIKNPLWAERFGKGLITVHPLGGCGMGDSAEGGVVDDEGRVFSATTGAGVHAGLYVCDGAIIPRPVGVNPFLTISALAERIARKIALRKGLTIPYDFRDDQRASPSSERRLGIEFTEAMRGHFFLSDDLDFAAAEEAGKAAGSTLDFTVTVRSDDLDSMLKRPEHEATLYGTIEAPVLSPHPLTVSRGTFQLLTHDPEAVGTRRMTYRMPLTDRFGRKLFLHGFKSIHDDEGFDVWSDTTTLFVTLHEGEDEDAPVIGRGVLRIQIRDFIRQLRTFKVTNAGGVIARFRATADFGRFFAGSLYDTYGGILARRSVLAPDAPPRARRELRTEAPDVHLLEADDGARLRLTRYPGGDRGPVLLVHGLGLCGEMFAIDTIETNLVEALSEAGYEPWILDHRGSAAHAPEKLRAFTGDEIAHEDIPAAVEKVRTLTGRDTLDVVAHGFGGAALLMAIIDGMPGVRSAVIAQAGLYLEAPESGRRLSALVRSLGRRSATIRPGPGGGRRGRVLDTALRLVPTAQGCRSTVCRRLTFLYGGLFEHDQLNAATHDALHELFGLPGAEALEHLAVMVRAGHVTSADGTPCLRNLERFAGIPVTFIHGAENRRLHAESSLRSAQELEAANPGTEYRNVLVPGYGDLDCLIGKQAAADVFPHVLDHLERAAGRAGEALPRPPART